MLNNKCRGIKQSKYTKLLYIPAEKYRCVFPFPYFNIVQTKVFDEVILINLNTDIDNAKGIVI